MLKSLYQDWMFVDDRPTCPRPGSGIPTAKVIRKIDMSKSFPCFNTSLTQETTHVSQRRWSNQQK